MLHLNLRKWGKKQTCENHCLIHHYSLIIPRHHEEVWTCSYGRMKATSLPHVLQPFWTLKSIEKPLLLLKAIKIFLLKPVGSNKFIFSSPSFDLQLLSVKGPC